MLMLVSPTMAQTPTPDVQLHEEALDLYRQGQRADALKKAQGAYQAKPLAKYLLFISRLQEEQGLLEEAHESCALYLRKYAQAENKGEAEECAQRTEAVLARLKPEITITTTPKGARVFLGGLLQEGATPWTARIDQGQHEVRIQLDGHTPVETQLQIDAEGQRQWDFELVPAGALARLTFRLSAEGMITRLDGKVIADGPFRGDKAIPPGQHTVRFSCGGQAQESVFTLAPKGALEVTTPRALVANGCDRATEVPYGWLTTGLGGATTGVGVGLALSAAGNDGEGMGLAYVVTGAGVALLATGIWMLLSDDDTTASHSGADQPVFGLWRF
ncbi:MAG: PEGA domain-containing protein [Bradymonadia bacterium]